MIHQLLSLKVPGENGSIEIQAPANIPTEGFSGSGGKILSLGVSILLIGATIFAFGFLLYGGINWMTSEGDKTKVESARRTITFAILGLLVCFLSFFVINMVGAALKVDFFHSPL